MTPVWIVLLVLGILALQLCIWIPLIIVFKRKSARQLAELEQEIARSGETVLIAPARGFYAGGSGDYSAVKGNGVIVLTDRRLVFKKLVGKPLEVPLALVEGVREDKWFLSAYHSGRQHLILRLRAGGEVGFIVNDQAEWLSALAARVPP